MLTLFSQAVHVRKNGMLVEACKKCTVCSSSIYLHLSMFQVLYSEGARIFWIHNMDPIGCLPFSVMMYQPKAHNVDRNGCVMPQNEMAKEFNRQLKEKVSQLRTQLPSAAFTYVDVYLAKYALISDAKQQGNCPKVVTITQIKVVGNVMVV